MSRQQRWEILAGVTGVTALGAVAATAAARGFAGRSQRLSDPHKEEDFAAVYADRASIVIADDGTPLAVREVGSVEADLTIVFVHGFCLRMSSWHFQRQQLRQRFGDRVRLVFFDLRGHGKSGAVTRGSATIAATGSDIAAVIRAVVPHGPLVLIGHSMGAMSMLALASSEPELFDSKVIGVGLISTATENLTDSPIAAALANPVVEAFRASAHRLPRVVSGGRDAMRSIVAPVLTAASFGGVFHSPATTAFATAMIHQTPIATVANFLQSLRTFTQPHALPVINRVPVLVACGSEDKMTPLAASVAIHAELDDCELVAVPGCGHLVPLERPEMITDAIERLVVRSVDRWQQ